MRRSGFDRLAIVGVYIAALVQAAQAALSNAPAVKMQFPLLDITSGMWSYVPFIFILCSSVLWLLERLAPRSRFLLEKPEHPAQPDHGPRIDYAEMPPVAPSVPMPSQNPAKIYVPDILARRYLEAVGDRKTDLQIEALLRPHLSKWIRLEGKALDISKNNYGITMQLAPLGDGGGSYFVEFQSSWTELLSSIHPREHVRLETQITDNGHRIRLVDGELL